MENSTYKANSYKNVMELLVDIEIDGQTHDYSPEEAQIINRIDVAAYALNHLPPLYASSQEGVELQVMRGQEEFGNLIEVAVTQALKVISHKPERNYTPLRPIAEIESELILAQQDFEEIAASLANIL
jgi:Late competence development protein ComFB